MTKQTEVLYNASCPVCRREIQHYEKISTEQALPIRYDDIGDVEALARWSIDPDAAAKRLHVRKDGQTYAGIPAFIVLWQDIPQMHWLARVVSVPGVYWLANKAYDYVLAPAIYRWHVARERKARRTG